MVGDGGFVFVDEDERWCAAVSSADSKVVEHAGMPEGDFAVPVDGVDADSVVGAEGRCGGGRCDGGVVGLPRCVSVEGAVGSMVVVDRLESVELVLGLRMVGMPVLLSDPECDQQVFECVLSAGESGGVAANMSAAQIAARATPEAYSIC